MVWLKAIGHSLRSHTNAAVGVFVCLWCLWWLQRGRRHIKLNTSHLYAFPVPARSPIPMTFSFDSNARTNHLVWDGFMVDGRTSGGCLDGRMDRNTWANTHGALRTEYESFSLIIAVERKQKINRKILCEMRKKAGNLNGIPASRHAGLWRWIEKIIAVAVVPDCKPYLATVCQTKHRHYVATIWYDLQVFTLLITLRMGGHSTAIKAPAVHTKQISTIFSRIFTLIKVICVCGAAKAARALCSKSALSLESNNYFSSCLQTSKSANVFCVLLRLCNSLSLHFSHASASPYSGVTQIIIIFVIN